MYLKPIHIKQGNHNLRMDKIIIAHGIFILTRNEDEEKHFTPMRAYGNKIHLFNKYLFSLAMQI